MALFPSTLHRFLCFRPWRALESEQMMQVRMMALFISLFASFALDRGFKIMAMKHARGLRRAFCCRLEIFYSIHRQSVMHIARLSIVGGVVWLLVITCLLLLMTLFLPQGLLLTALAFAVGGAASNLLDRCVHHGVINCLRFQGRIMFNLADIAIVGGTSIALISYFCGALL